MNVFDDNILSVCNDVCQNLADLKTARNFSQKHSNKKNSFRNTYKNDNLIKRFLGNVLKLLKAVSLKIYSEEKVEITVCDRDTADALAFSFSKVELSFLKHFYKYLFALASYYKYYDSSLSYNFIFVYEFLYKIKNFAKERFHLLIFDDLDSLVPQEDYSSEYREKIAEKLENTKLYNLYEGDIFYITKTKPFFVNGRIYYELTVKHASEAFGKFAKFTVFSKYSVPAFYAVRLSFLFSSIFVSGREMRIRILDSFKVAIRMIEIDGLASALNEPYESIDLNEYDALMSYLTRSGDNLLDIIDLNDKEYDALKSTILNGVRSSFIFGLFDKCRDMCLKRKNGYVTLRYAILKMRHRIFQSIISDEQNSSLSDCYLKNECIPFENMPFDSALPEHNPNIFDIFISLSKKGRTCELLSRKINNNAENGIIFTPISSLKNFDNIKKLVEQFNMNLSQAHFEERKLIVDGKDIFINGYVKDTFDILSSLFQFVGKGIPDYAKYASDFLQSEYFVDSAEKADIISKAFSNNTITAVFGSAGTGKTVLMNHLSHVFNNASKLLLAKTNSAVEYMRTNINSDNCVFKTIDSWLLSETNEFDMLFVDECPTIDNASMRKVLKKISCKAIVLVGDLFQIQSIRFGNWFGLCRYLLPTNATFELTVPYRTNNLELVDLFNKVRTLDKNLFDHIIENGYRTDFDDSLFYKDEEDEAILCFDYDGLYGINNLNSFLQNSNAYVPETWDSFQYKYGDPIIFTDNNRYFSVLHKNLKGKILNVDKTPYKITFKLEVFEKIDIDKASEMGIEVCECENNKHSTIILSVDKYDENPLRERTNFHTVPFQLAYALSIYKVQGMEFDSIKLIITEESFKNITHNLLYTAITRAKKKLKIYCSKSTLKKLFETLTPFDPKEKVLSFAKHNASKIEKIISKKRN